MEPLSAASSILSVLDISFRVTSALVNYTEDTRNASTERRILAEEAACLSNILQRLLDRAHDKALDLKWLDSRKDLLRQFRRAYEDLAGALKIDVGTGQLKSESRMKAVRTAAKWSFTKPEVYSLVERVTRLQQYANMMLLIDQSDLLEGLDKQQQQDNKIKAKAAVLSWLSPLHMTRVHQSIAERAQAGSGRWFLNSELFLDWQSGDQKLLWCFGIPGAGKTVLASIVVDHLRHQKVQHHDSSDIGIAMVYLKYNDPEQSLNNLLGSLFKQLLQEQDFLPNSVKKLYETFGELGIPPSLQDLSEAFPSLLGRYSRVFLIIDALDECDNETRWGILETLREFQPKVFILVLSRFKGDIDDELEDFKRLEIKATKADIELFIDAQIHKNANLRRLVRKSTSLRGDIKAGVVKTAKEMFLLARLHVDSLASAAALSIGHVRNKLKTLPTTLTTTYDGAMVRVTSQDEECKTIALRTLAWVAYSFRPLSLKELQHALAVEPGSSELNEELIMDEQSITALCAGLITIDLSTGAVSFVHYTTHDYFVEKRQIYFPEFHGTITMTCATYLTMPALYAASVGTIVRRYPLAYYAAQYLGEHARQHPEETLEQTTLEAVCQLLAHSKKRKPLIALLEGLDLIKSGFYSSDDQEALEEKSASQASPSFSDSAETLLSIESSSKMIEVTALHLAASMGLAKVASMLLKETPNIDAVDETGKTALAVAMERGFGKAVEFLVNSGARVDLNEPHGQHVFLLLVEKRWFAVADTVAERAKMTAVAANTNVPLIVSAYACDTEAISHLLERVRQSVENQKSKELALFVAIEKGNLEVARMLLAAGVDVNSRDSTGSTSLHRATRREAEHLMRLLLDHGAEVDLKNDEWCTPWRANVHSRNAKILEILRAAGADPNTRDHDGCTALYYSAASGHTEVVKFLLESGTNPSLRTDYDWAPIHWAAYHGHIECVNLLVNAGAELSPISDQGMTPLDLAFKNDQAAMSDFLVKTGAREAKEMVTEKELENSVHINDAASSLTIAEGNEAIGLTLAFDLPMDTSLFIGQFVYPHRTRSLRHMHDFSGEKHQPYQISHLMNSAIPSISVRRSAIRPNMDEYPLRPEIWKRENLLYDISRITADYQELELRASEETSLSGTISMRRDWSGSWKAHHHNEGSTKLLFRTMPDWSQPGNQGSRWATGDGRLMARVSPGLESVMRVEQDLDPQHLDALVTCWIAKQWSDIVTKQRGKI